VAPLDRRRRRRRISRAGALTVAGLLAAVLVVALAVGGLLRVRSQSAGYEAAIDRSYAAQVRLVVSTSNALSARFHHLLATMTAETRTAFQVGLDTLVAASAAVATQARTAASPAPADGAGADVSAAMADRAAAIRRFRSVVDRLLGMAPLPVAGAPDPTRVAALRPLSAGAAAARLASVGELLGRSDRSYAEGRRALRHAPGAATLPPSVWSGRTAAWSPSGTVAMVDALTSSGTLAAVRDVALVTHTLSLTPAPLPVAGSATQGVSLLPPTGRVRVSVVVANEGNVDERGVVVRDSLQRVPTGTVGAGSVHQGPPVRVSLQAHSSTSVSLGAADVVPGRRYTLTVSVDPPFPDPPGALTSAALSVRIGPPGPPSVAQLLPARGRPGGGTAVTILGSGFTWVSAVTFGSARARFKVVSSTQITAVAPPGSGTVAVHVTNPGGSSVAVPADRFVYRRG